MTTQYLMAHNSNKYFHTEIVQKLMTTQYLIAHNNNKYFQFAPQNIAKMGPTSQDDKDLC